jgi:hypothetical protein
MGTITRMIIERAIGDHVYVQVGEEIPPADIYILECFKKEYEYFRDFKAKGKVISLVHSTPPCEPAIHSDVVVCLSHASARGRDAIVIPGGLGVWPHRDHGTFFGCILRNADGKFHPNWNSSMGRILTAIEKTELYVITNKLTGLWLGDRINYVTTVVISDDDQKLSHLSKLAVAVFMHGAFEETFCMSVLECMNAGLPIVYLYQPALFEVAGEDQLCCDSADEVVRKTIGLLLDSRKAKALGSLAKYRANRLFTDVRMIAAWDELLASL